MSQIADTNVRGQANLPKTNLADSYLDNSRRRHRIAMKPKVTQSHCALELLESHDWISKKNEANVFLLGHFLQLIFTSYYFSGYLFGS